MSDAMKELQERKDRFTEGYPRMSQEGLIVRNVEEEEAGYQFKKIHRNFALDVTVDNLAHLCSHPTAMRHLMTLEMDKEYTCHTWVPSKNQSKENPALVDQTKCLPYVTELSQMIDHYVGGNYKLNWMGKLAQDLIERNK
jgi:hypothetical protein